MRNSIIEAVALFTQHGRARLGSECLVVQKLFRIALLGLSCALLANAGYDNWAAPIRGGSNFIYTQYSGGVGVFDSYVVSNYNSNNPAFSVINTDLSEMISNGQRTIRIPVSFTSDTSNGPSSYTDCTGTSNNYDIMLASGSGLASQCAADLGALITKLQSDGFQYIEISFWAQFGNYAKNWTSWDQNTFETNWNFIVNTRTLVRNSLNLNTIHAPLFDLGNEMAAFDTTGGIPLEYMQELWGNYANVYGTGDSFGFSIAGSLSGDQGVVENLHNIYNGAYGNWGYPTILEIHMGDGVLADDENEVIDFDSDLTSAGIPSSFIIGEAPQNSVNDAEGLAAGAETVLTGASRRQCWWLAQWPTGSVGTNFTNYLNAGW